MIGVVAGIYGLMSVVAVVVYGIDKRAARLGRSRTPEVTLHLIELLGGWPGAWLMQRWIRHKNSKLGYQMVFWTIVAAHAAGWFLAYRY